MLKCEMCLGRRIDAELAVLRSADRGIEYHEGNAIEISNDNRISVKVDNATIRIDPVSGALTVDIPDTHAVNSIVEALSRYPLNHNYNDLRPLVPDGPNRGKWATENIGANNNPIYLKNGVITPANTDIGSASRPIYMNDGALSQCGNSLDVDITGNAATASRLSSSRNISLTGAVTGSASFTGNSDIEIDTSLGAALEQAINAGSLKFRYYSITQFNQDITLPRTPCNNYLLYILSDSFIELEQSVGSSSSILANVIEGFIMGRINGTNRLFRLGSGMGFSSEVVSSREEISYYRQAIMNSEYFSLGGLVNSAKILLFYM